MGVPKSKCTQEVIDAIVSAHQSGYGPMAAAKAAGIAASTYFDWVLKKPEVSEVIKKARAEGEELVRERNLEIIQSAAAGKEGEDGRKPVWQAAAWILERKFPKEFGRFEPIKQEQTSNAINIVINKPERPSGS